MTLTRRSLVAMAAIAVATVFLPTAITAIALIVVVAASIADAWTVRALPHVVRSAPPILSRGVAGRVSISSAESRTVIKQAVASPDLRVEPSQGSETLDAAILANRRGKHLLAPVATRRTGPLGLGAWHHQVGPSHEINVYPDLVAAARLATEVRLGLFRDEGRRARGPLGLGTELESIREYQPDDDIRQVNWRATARTGHPMSNTFRIEQDRDVICLLDCGRLMASRLTKSDGTVLTRLDSAVDTVAAMAAVSEELGDRIGLTAFADRIIRKLAPRRDGAGVVVDAIHDLEPLSVDSDYETAVAAVAGRKRAFVLVLTDLLDPTAAKPLLASLPTLARHHTLAVATVQDPALRDLLRTPAADMTDVARTVVAADVVAKRESIAAELRHLGAEVIDAPAESLARRCVGAYVSAKRLARL